MRWFPRLVDNEKTMIENWPTYVCGNCHKTNKEVRMLTETMCIPCHDELVETRRAAKLIAAKIILQHEPASAARKMLLEFLDS